MIPFRYFLRIQLYDEFYRQGQLQRKHEQLQQMIVRQQEELRVVKEQLLLARLGILPPLANVTNVCIYHILMRNRICANHSKVDQRT